VMTEAQELALQDAHLDHLARLHEAGQLLAAGPVGGDSPYVGLSILTVPALGRRRAGRVISPRSSACGPWPAVWPPPAAGQPR
jgi:hypothetical protein